ncbi:MAG: hypothetical protein NXI31_22520 [bacterium]|nr:hypothetical protein [bacterium]
MRLAVALLLAIAAGAVIVAVGRWASDDGASGGAAPVRAEARDRGEADQREPVEPAVAVEPIQRPRAATATARLELPDGSHVEPLNGVSGRLSLTGHWGNRPWSPIVGVERSDRGVDWYVHADGTRSTTEMKWRSDLGRKDAMVRLAVPQHGTPAIKR